jgi:hypothetical protein
MSALPASPAIVDRLVNHQKLAGIRQRQHMRVEVGIGQRRDSSA